MTDILRIATRSSPLAIWQAEYVQQRLIVLNPALTVELVRIKTQGDIILDTPLAKIGGKGLFVKELEQAMLDGRADIAVHSMKDVPMELPDGLTLAVICERDDPRDAFVSNVYERFDDLPFGAHVGTSSLRRSAQLKAARPDLRISSLRGNVQTRLGKLDAGEFDAILLAAAGFDVVSHLAVLDAAFPKSVKAGAAGLADASLLGGMIVKVGSRMIDSSIRTKLQRLELSLKGAA